MEEDVAHPQQGGGGATGVWIIFKGCGTGGTALSIGDLGGHISHRQGPGEGSGPGSETADGTATGKDTGREVEINPDGGVKG